MLVLTRQVNGALVINTEAGEVKITLLGTRGSQARLGIEAPKEIEVHREEIWDKIKKDRSNQS